MKKAKIIMKPRSITQESKKIPSTIDQEMKTKLTSEELCYLPASTLIGLFKAKKISPVDMLNAQIERINKFNPELNAITATHYEEAMIQAKESEKRYEAGNPRALEGITCAIKDEVDVAGWRTTMGSLILKDAPLAKKDAPLTKLLRDAGVVMHVQTNVPEYYCNLVTWNRLFGICRNPWNLEYTPGGSSGGAAASLAAGFTTLATGSDMGGSIRFPAAMTGLYGFKPPYGRVATSLVQYESEGPMSRTFEDLNLFQNAITGPTPEMMSALKPKLEYPMKYESIKGLRIAYDPMSAWGVPIDETVKESMEKTVATLRSLGVTVTEVDLGFRAADFEIYALGIFSTSIGPFCFNGPSQNPSLITPYMMHLLQNYKDKISPQHIANAEDWIQLHNEEIQRKVFLSGFDAIIMPTMCSPYVKADMGTTPENTVITINGKSYSAATWNYSFTWPWNMLGHYPVVNVPIDVTKENIPVGMQIIGNIQDDLSAFRIASAWSQSSSAFFHAKKFPELKDKKIASKHLEMKRFD